MGMGITVCERTVWMLMNQAGIYGLPGRPGSSGYAASSTADDLVNRKFHRLRPNELWVTDITQHRTREGWLYCAAVLDAYSRRIVGWSIDSTQDSTLVVNALDMAIRNRRPEPAASSTPITEPSSPRGSSATRSARPACCRRSAPSATASTTR